MVYFSGCAEEDKYKPSIYKCDGQGTIEYSNGSIYKGECKKNNRDGHGVITYYWGDKYDGEWKDNKKNGEGKYINQYGIYTGIWKDGNLTKVTNQDSYVDTYKYFNKIRKQAMMIELDTNGILEDSAQNHSNYIMIHDDKLEGLSYHSEERREEGFTGVKSGDRAIYQGYFSKSVGEGISHQKTAKMSINSLMTAIYHRFGILNFIADEVGVGFTQESNSMIRNFVYNRGNSRLNYLCQYDNYSSGRYYYKVCADDNHRIQSELFKSAKSDIATRNPKYVLWPTDKSVNNLYKFSGETPNPIPDYNETGNPISIQFNEYYYSNKIDIKSFKLFQEKKEITETRVLTENTDPNKRFSNYQYALFPLKVLKKNTIYRAEFSYRYNSRDKNIVWSFRTMK